MLQNLLSLFSGTPAPERLDDGDIQICLAALLVHVAKTDGHYDPSEQAAIITVLRARFSLSEAQAIDVRSAAEALEETATDTVRFTRVVKQVVPYEERGGIIEALWQVVLADGKRDQDEDGYMRLVANLLGVNDKDSALARQKVMAQL